MVFIDIRWTKNYLSIIPPPSSNTAPKAGLKLNIQKTKITAPSPITSRQIYACLCVSCSVVSSSLQPHRLQPTRLLCPWNIPGKNTGVGRHFLLQWIFPVQGSNPGIPHCRQILYNLSYQGSPWQIDGGKTRKTVTDFIVLGSKITTNNDCSHEIKRCLLLGRKVMTNLDSILRRRDITLPTNICIVKAMVFQQSCINVRVGP